SSVLAPSKLPHENLSLSTMKSEKIAVSVKLCERIYESSQTSAILQISHLSASEKDRFGD
ncbi:hypothetical protein PMAYCL1PPCAC_20404, partial [Pristionchus mayeri]